MTNVLRTLVLLTLATGQLLVAGQALAMPACHQAGGDMSAHAGMNELARYENEIRRLEEVRHAKLSPPLVTYYTL